MPVLRPSPAPATRLSWLADLRQSARSHFARLARLSLWLLLANVTSSCLIEDPPPYKQPSQTPPRLNLRKAAPLIDQVLELKTGDRISFNVPVSSEDAGDKLQGLLLLDYKGEQQLPWLQVAEVQPSTLDDDTRALRLDWVVPNSISEDGCHRLTLLVSHEKNLGVKIKDPNDVAVAVWWANINADADTSGKLNDCPLATEESP